MKSGGILSPGAQGVGSVGTLNIVTGLTNASPILNFDLSASPAGANDRINLSGTLAMSGTQTFNFNLTEFALGEGTYGLIEGASSSTASGVLLTHNLPGSTRQTFSLSRPAAGSNPSYIRLNVVGSAASLIWRGTNGASWDTSTVNWANGSTPDTYYNLDAVTFDDTGANAANVTLGSALTPGIITVNAAQNYAFNGSGALAGTSPLTKRGSGTLTIATVNTNYAGAIYLFGGTLAAAAGSSLGSGTLTISNSATFSLPAADPGVAFSGSVIVPANSTGTISSGSASNDLSGKLFSGNSNSVLNLAGYVSFSGVNSAQFDNFNGTLNIQPGATLRFSADNSGKSFGSLAPLFTVNGTIAPRNAGNTIALGRLAGSGSLAGPQTTNGSGDTLYVIGGNNSDSVFNGVISSNSAALDGEVAITKTGSGALTLTGASTYSGGTTVDGGTLRVNNSSGSGTGSGDVEIFSGATLSGNGTISGTTTIDSGATLAPGDPAGTLNFGGSLTLNDGSLLQFSLGTNSDRVAVAGNLFLSGQLSVTNGGGFGPGTYTLFTCGGALALDDLTLVLAPAGYNYAFDTNTAGSVKLIVSLPTPPNFTGVSVNGNNLTFAGSNGVAQGNYYVLQSSNLINWTPLVTNQFDTNGGFRFTTNLPGSAPQNFFRLQLP